MDNLMQQPAILDSGIGPRQVASWLEWQGWALASSLGEVAERWSGADVSVIVPLQPSSPDFHLRWNELLSSLSRHFQLDTGGILLAIKREGSIRVLHDED
jgi:hypothetical protein